MLTIAKNYTVAEDEDFVFRSYRPRKPLGTETVDFYETFEDSVNRVAKYLTYLGLKYKLLTFMEEAKEFNTLLSKGIQSGHIDLYENIDMLGFFYTYGLPKRESITKLTIKLDQKDLSEELCIKYLKAATIINAIYYEHTYKELGDVYPNRLLTLVIRNPSVSLELMILQTYLLSYKIGLKTGKLVENNDLNERVKTALSDYNKKDMLSTQVSFITRAYHSDLLL